ncbi:MAG TPA: DUF459 domain-containing protein [Myxococcaceae bacterium]|nr:DUF459 domain-containing protein [Myxococcaceae bacterium]
MMGVLGVWLSVAAALPVPVASAKNLERGTERAVERMMSPELRRPAPQKVLIIGASSIEYYVGAAIERRLRAHRGVQVIRVGKLSSGLARPEFFDWPAELEQRMQRHRPDLVIAMLGGNDNQTLVDPRGRHQHPGTEGWDREYARRIGLLVDHAHSGGAQIIFLGSPIMRSASFSGKIERINRVTAEAAAAKGAGYFSTWELMADAAGEYLEVLEYGGKSETPRLADGIHFSRHGAAYTAERLDWWLQRTHRLTPKNPALAEAVRLSFASQALGRPAAYLAFVPQGLERDARLPVLYVLHDEGGSEVDWSFHAHETLQRLAARHRLIIVTPDVGADNWYLESASVEGGRAETFLTEELLPHVERMLPAGEGRGITGVGMGGHGALSLALKYPHLFRSASSLAGAVDLTRKARNAALVARLGTLKDAPTLWERHSTLHLTRAHPDRARELALLISTGEDDAHLAENLELHRLLNTLGVDHGFDDAIDGKGWKAWAQVLPRHVAWQAVQLKPLSAGIARMTAEDAERGVR